MSTHRKGGVRRGSYPPARFYSLLIFALMMTMMMVGMIIVLSGK